MATKTYKKKTTAKTIAKRRKGSQSVYKVKGGYRVGKTQKKTTRRKTTRKRGRR